MKQPRDFKNMALKSLVVLGLWTIVVLLISSVTILQEVQAGVSVNLGGIFLYEFVCISPWIISTPAIIWLARTYRFDKKPLFKSFAIHFFAAAFIFSFHSLVQSNAVFYYFDTMSFSWGYIWTDFISFLDMRVILYIGMLLIVYVVDFQKKDREIKLRKSKLKADLNKAKFQALLNQIQPDFLLGSIDAIKEKLDQDIDEAEEILTDFSDLLRIMLNSIEREEVAVYHDIKSYNLYVNIMNQRLDPKIQKKTDIDEDCYHALIPSFLLLMPLFEKIIHLQNQNSSSLASICYSAKRINEDIDLSVSIEGANIINNDIAEYLQNGGFSEVVGNLKSKYGEQIEFKSKSESDFILVGLTMPFKRAEKIDEMQRFKTVRLK